MATTTEEATSAILSTNSCFSHHHDDHNLLFSVGSNPPPPSSALAAKKKRNLPGTPDPEAEVIALSPKTLMATNRFLCEICGKGFQRDQNLQLHRRGHNLPWKLKQRSSKEIRKRVYVCPEKSCVHHHPSRALGDLTGIKKHFCRKHGEKKWRCDKCSKRYAVQSDWKAHSKTCGTREYKCDCGTFFSRRDSFITHRAFCDALAEETARMNAASTISSFAAAAAASNLSYNLMGAPLGHHVAPHFSSIFKPISTIHDNHHQQHKAEIEILHNQETRGMTFWMSQGGPPPQQHQLVHEAIIRSNANPNNNHIIQQEINIQSMTSPRPMCGDNTPDLPPRSSHPEHHHCDLSWPIVGLNNSNGSCITSTTAALPLSNGKEAAAAAASSGSCQHHDLVNVPSSYRIQQQQQQGGGVLSSSPPSANTSATALLLKAAQMGATSTTDPSLLGSLGISKPCSNNNSSSDVSSTQALMVQPHHHGNRFCGLYGTTTTTTTTNSSHHNRSPFVSQHVLESFNSSAGRIGTTGDILTLNHVQLQQQQQQQQQLQAMYPALKMQKTFQSSEDCGGGGGQTRDFLGVGAAAVQALCHPSSINGWI